MIDYCWIHIFFKTCYLRQLTPRFLSLLTHHRRERRGPPPAPRTRVLGQLSWTPELIQLSEVWSFSWFSWQKLGAMGNCNACVRAEAEEEKESKKRKPKKSKERRANPYAEDPIRSPAAIRVLKDVIPLSHRTRIGDKYVLGRELGRGEFGITYLCTDRETKEALACKSISKRKLRTAVDIEDVRREVCCSYSKFSCFYSRTHDFSRSFPIFWLGFLFWDILHTCKLLPFCLMRRQEYLLLSLCSLQL